MFLFDEKEVKTKHIVLYIVLAYLFSLAVRYIWVYQFKDVSSFYWHDQLMINTNDGYFFATAIKHLLFDSNPHNQLLPVAIDTYPGTIYSIYFLAKVLPFSLDTIILYAPAFISSLIVIPIILIMRLFGMSFLGFLAALLASITWSFYNRTMTGYFDTDMYALVFPMFILYFTMAFFVKRDLLYAFIATLVTAFYVVFYPQGYAAIGGLFATLLIYGFFTMKKENIFYISIILFSISLLKLALLIKIVLLTALYIVSYQKKLPQKSLLFGAVGSVVVFLLFSNVISLILSKINWYTTTGTEGVKLHFYDVAQTIREAGKIPFETFANRISGSIPSFLLGFVGYVFLVYKKREFLLFLPFVAIGFFAHFGGLRFTVYAIPAFAVGVVYLFYTIYAFVFKDAKTKNIALFITTLILLYPNILHVIRYQVPTVFTKQEVEVLDKLKHISSNKDYTLTWWDYGYPIWYYSDTNTLIDGGKHHRDNFIISKILTSTSQNLLANLSRLSVEKYAKDHLAYSPVAKEIFKDKDPNLFLEELKESSFKLPKKTRDIYLYLPNRLLNIFPTVDLFSNIDLETGNKKYNTFFYVSRDFLENAKYLNLGNGIILDKEKSLLKVGANEVPLKSIYITEYSQDGKLKVKKQDLYPQGNLNMIFMKNYHQIILLDDRMLKSNFIQMFVFENYDKELFEPSIMTPWAKVYKLKR